MRPRAVVALALALLAPMACLERKERFTVYENGLVEVVVEAVADSPEELDGPDPLPEAFSGWIVEESEVRSERDGEEQVRYRRVASNAFPPDVPLPDTWASAGAPEVRRASALRFPTTVRIERRRDGTWYHFRRVYEPRSWAPLAHLRETILDPAVQGQDGVDPSAIGPDRRRAIASALARYEVGRKLLLGQEAFFETTPERGQDGWLRAERVLRAFADEASVSAAEVLFPQPGETPALEAQRTARLAEATARFKAELDDRLQLALRESCSYGPSEVQRFFARLATLEATVSVTEDLADDSFEIEVTLPGTIEESNGTVTGGSTVTWSFKGDALRDRSIELMASARLPR